MVKQLIKHVLHLELRGKKRPGKSSKTVQVYVSEMESDPNDLVITLERASDDITGNTHFSRTRLWCDHYDPKTKTATYRHSVRKSDRLADEIEFYGWKRVGELEGSGSQPPEATLAASASLGKVKGEIKP